MLQTLGRFPWIFSPIIYLVVAHRLNRSLRLTGVVLCLYDSGTRLASEVSGDVEDFFDRQSAMPGPWKNARCFTTRIRRNIRLAEAPSFGQSIFQYDPQSHGAEDYEQLAREIETCGAPALLAAG